MENLEILPGLQFVRNITETDIRKDFQTLLSRLVDIIGIIKETMGYLLFARNWNCYY